MNKKISLVVLIVLFAGCASQGKKTARFRVGQFLYTTQTAVISFYDGNNEVRSMNLSYGALSGYRKIEANVYSIKVWADSTLLLEKELGLDHNGTYTLLLTGIPKKGQAVNKESIGNILHGIAEGSEGITSNSYLPQLLIKVDFFTTEKNKGKVALMNLLPGSAPMSVELDGAEGKTEIGAVAYPLSSETKNIGAGAYVAKLRLGGSPQTTKLGRLEIEEDVLYSLFIIPDPMKYIDHPKFIIGRTEKVSHSLSF